jgi:hypothetical protein
MVDTKCLITLRVNAALADAAPSFLLFVHSPIVIVGDAKVPFPVLDNTTGFTGRILPADSSVLDIKFVCALGLTTDRTGD